MSVETNSYNINYPNENGSFGVSRGCTFSLYNLIFRTINLIKMKINLFYSLMAVCLIMLASCQQTPEAPVAAATVETPAPPDMAAIKAEIQGLENTWAIASKAKDAVTIVAFYADDAISLTNNKPIITGKADIQKEIEAEFANRKDANSVVKYDVQDVFGGENLVTEVGKTTVTDATGKVTYTGKYMVIWEKRNGKWLVIRDIYNDDAKEK